jgi:uncharacterized membrane protein
MTTDYRVLLLAGLTILLWGFWGRRASDWLSGFSAITSRSNASPASILVPLTATYSAVSAALSYAFVDERPNVSQWIGIVFVVIGTTLLLLGPTATVTPETSLRQ